METLAVLGSTGSIGTQTLDIVRHFPDRFSIKLLSAKRASEKLLQQVKEFKPKYVLTEEKPSKRWLSELPNETKHLSGSENLKEILKGEKIDKVVNAVSGIYGIEPSFEVLKNTDAKLLLANKETIIAAGELLKPYLSRIIPVDSEHNAVFQLMENLNRKHLKKVYLTASGGPFRRKTKEELKKVSPEQALKHPRWKMGKKITVDSATLMNKGFEVIEAHYLFNIPFEDIEVLIHPQSLVHGLVETIDGNIFALLSPTDMRFPIQHALFYPERVETPLKGLNLFDLQLEFEKPDFETFECLKLAYTFGRKGFPYTALLVGADEGAVELFLERKIDFLRIAEVIEKVVETLGEKYKTEKPGLKLIPQLVKEAYLTVKNSV
jgi:1-deoxy-D-xylulose-5-phosphate reductoisomerase